MGWTNFQGGCSEPQLLLIGGETETCSGTSPTVGWCLTHPDGVDQENVCIFSGASAGGTAQCAEICCPAPWGTTDGDTPPCGYPIVAMTYNGPISGTPKTGLLIRTRTSTDSDCVGVGFYIDESDNTVYCYKFEHENIATGGTLLASAPSQGPGFYFMDCWMFASNEWDPPSGFVALSYDATGPFTSATLFEIEPAWLFETTADAITEMGAGGGITCCVWGRREGEDSLASWTAMSGECGNCYPCGIEPCDTADENCTQTLEDCGV